MLTDRKHKRQFFTVRIFLVGITEIWLVRPCTYSRYNSNRNNPLWINISTRHSVIWVLFKTVESRIILIALCYKNYSNTNNKNIILSYILKPVKFQGEFKQHFKAYSYLFRYCDKLNVKIDFYFKLLIFE